ncbi:MAG: hypothetical protein NTY19_08255 [Planctomycetota bacterium]|nr:hypothetical protein [Planctomycetota bacterium]
MVRRSTLQIRKPSTVAAPKPLSLPLQRPRLCVHSRQYETVEAWLRGYGPLDAILDVGCGRSTVATLGAFRLRYTIDPLPRPPIPDVIALSGLFPDDWHPQTRFKPSAIVCLDVLHDHWKPSSLAQHLLRRTERVIVSIPWGIELPAESDPVNVLVAWFGRRPRRWEVERTFPPRVVAEFM